MSPPRVIVTMFSASQSERLGSWREHAERVVGAVAVPPQGPSHGGAVWHLASVNNRMLARRTAVFASVADAIEDAGRQLAAQGDLEPVLTRDRRLLALGWYLRSGDVPVIVSARWYSTDRDRRKSLDGARDALGAAIIAPATRIAAPSVALRTPRR